MHGILSDLKEGIIRRRAGMSGHFIAETMCDRLVSCQFINEFPLRRDRPGPGISGFCWLRQIMITVNPLAVVRLPVLAGAKTGQKSHVPRTG